MRLPKPAKLMAVLENSPVLCAYGLQRSGSTSPAPVQVNSRRHSRKQLCSSLPSAANPIALGKREANPNVDL